jgi:hypothetical protein
LKKKLHLEIVRHNTTWQKRAEGHFAAGGRARLGWLLGDVSNPLRLSAAHYSDVNEKHMTSKQYHAVGGVRNGSNSIFFDFPFASHYFLAVALHCTSSSAVAHIVIV